MPFSSRNLIGTFLTASVAIAALRLLPSAGDAGSPGLRTIPARALGARAVGGEDLPSVPYMLSEEA